MLFVFSRAVVETMAAPPSPGELLATAGMGAVAVLAIWLYTAYSLINVLFRCSDNPLFRLAALVAAVVGTWSTLILYLVAKMFGAWPCK